MNAYTLEQQLEQDNEQYSDIAYKESQLTVKKNPLHDLQDYFAGNIQVESCERDEEQTHDTYDNHIDWQLSYGDTNHGYSFNL